MMQKIHQQLIFWSGYDIVNFTCIVLWVV